eukprot:6204189-Prymnesium_polylepis.1
MPPPSVPLPFVQLEAVFNHANVWLPRASLDPAALRYDFSDGAAWTPFVSQRIAAAGRPRPFYAPARLPGKPPPERLHAIEVQVRDGLLGQLRAVRAGQAAPINRLTPLVEHLEAGLAIHERACAYEPTAQQQLDAWRHALKQKLPIDSTFTGQPVYYTYTDVKRMRKHLFAACPYAALQNAGLHYVLAVRCVGYFGGVVCVWVYFGVVDTSLLS